MNAVHIVFDDGRIETGFHTPTNGAWDGCLQWLDGLGTRRDAKVKFLIRVPIPYVPPEKPQ